MRFARIVLILLFPIAWPIYFLLWCRRNPDEVRHALRATGDLIRRHPERAAWAGVFFGGVAVIGHLADREFPAMTIGAVVAGWCGWLLIKWRRARRPVPPVARADRRAGLFVYGTLQFPVVLRELLGRVPDSEIASIAGWRVAALPGRVYPGLVPDAGAVARGRVLSGLDAAEWSILDAFEDEEYELRTLRTERDAVLAYVWTAEAAEQDWQRDDFEATHLDDFVSRCGQWRTAS